MTCIIIEDQPPAQRILQRFIRDIGTLELKGTYPDATAAIDQLKAESIDLVFLDIHLPKISGIEFLKILTNRPSIILTTAFSEYAVESYELNVVDYLLKPFSFERFVQAVSKVQEQSTDNKKVADRAKVDGEVFIKSGYDHIKVVIPDIHYIKSDADYTEIHLNDKKHISSEPLRFWADYLDSNQFIRIHKSFIVNTSKIEKISGNRIQLVSGEALPLGRAYKEQFSKKFLN